MKINSPRKTVRKRLLKDLQRCRSVPDRCRRAGIFRPVGRGGDGSGSNGIVRKAIGAPCCLAAACTAALASGVVEAKDQINV